MFSPRSDAAEPPGATPVTAAFASAPATVLATASMQARESPHGVARRTPAAPATAGERAASPMARRALELSVALVNLTSQPSAHPSQHAAPAAHNTAARDGSLGGDAGHTGAARGPAGSDEPVLLPRRAPPQPPVGSLAPFLDSRNTGRPPQGSPAYSSPTYNSPALAGTTSSAPAHSVAGGFGADTGDALTLQLLAQSPVAQNALQQLSHERDRVASLCATVCPCGVERVNSSITCVRVVQELASVQLAWTKLTEERQRFETERAAFSDFHAHATQSQHAITSQLASLKEELVEQQARLRMQSVQVAAERDILKEAKADLEADRQALVRALQRLVRKRWLLIATALCARTVQSAPPMQKLPPCRRVLRQRTPDFLKKPLDFATSRNPSRSSANLRGAIAMRSEHRSRHFAKSCVVWQHSETHP